MCSAPLTFFETLALGTIGLGFILLMIEVCASSLRVTKKKCFFTRSKWIITLIRLTQIFNAASLFGTASNNRGAWA